MLACKLFDNLSQHPKPKLEFSYSEARELLKYGAVNEAGKLIGFQHHHKHSYYISNSTILGFTRAERHVVALVSRFSRKGYLKRVILNINPI